MQRDSFTWFPLSERQIALVRSAEMDDGVLARNAVSRLACYLPVDAERLTRAVDRTIARHPVLCSSFDFLPGRVPRHVVHPLVEARTRVVDLRRPGMDQSPVAERDLGSSSTRLFDLGHAPLVRVAVHQLRDEEFWLSVVSHPAVLDRWSQRAFLAEILTRYREPSPRPEPDVIALARPQPPLAVEGETANDTAAIAAWAGSFANVTAAAPGFWIAPAEGETPGQAEPELTPATPLSHEIDLSDEHVARLAALAHELGVPIADLTLAAHAKAVAVATGRATVVVGVESDRRNQAEPRPLGMLTAVLPVKISVAPGSWTALVEEVRRATRSATAFADLSHLRVQRILHVGQLLDSSFVYSEQALEADLLNGDTGDLGPLAGHTGGTSDTESHARAPFQGAILVEFFHGTATGRMRLRVTAGTGLTRRQLAEVARLHAETLEHCLAAERAHQTLSPLTARQRHLTLVQWNGHERSHDLDHPVHELVERQVRRTPQVVAVVDSSGSLTYAELNARANRLAHRLRALGVEVGSVVGVYARRDAGMLVAFLAVLKTGAAYLPLDPKQPADRVAYMLGDAHAAVVLSDGTYADAVPDGPWEIHRLGGPDDTGTAFPDSDLGRTSTAADLMYVMYTSGSTGPPKGVEVPHRGVANYLWCCVEAFTGNGEGGAPVFSSVAFDMVVPNIYVPLLIGQRVCMIEEDLDLLALTEKLKELAPFTFIKLTPGQLDTFSELLSPQEARRLAGTLAVGADAFSVRTLRHWRRLDPATPILNEYGPTEASVGNSVHFVDGTEEGELLPIGRPIPNTTMYVLDGTLAPVPIGVPGDLYIGGVCVVRGYANRPDLTRERFVEDPFDARPGARMYRTGDIARWLPSGVLDFLGRVDDQLKIRGYRVDPAEVEAAMVRHPSVSEAVVSRVGATRETLALAGYYVAADGLPPEEIRVFLAGILPEYLVPGFLIPIPAIPLNRNGKVDRGALPTPGPRQTNRARQKTAVDADRFTRRVWREVYGVDSVGLDDPVAAPDGDLVRETQLALRLADTTKITMGDALGLVTRAKTFGELSEQLARRVPGHGESAGSAPAAAEGPRTGTVNAGKTSR